MDSGAAEPRRRSDVSFLERKLRSLTLRRNPSEVFPEVIGDLGLNLLHEPPHCLIDFIFVHGLRGGSRKTWSASPNPAHFWPKVWLPADPDFKNVRIHSFGYNSDWLDRKGNLLNIHDFAQSLMEELENSPSLRRTKNTRIVFIAHSMGGLVIKRACLLSRENPSFHDLGARIHSLYFLATPHRGSDLAETLSNMLKAFPTGSKPFVGSLERGSETIITLNDQFRHICKDVAIHSFLESVPTNWGAVSSLVVDKQSATLGYPNERVQALNADHRSICKFDSPDDSNFRTIRNRLASTVEDIERNEPKIRYNEYREDMKLISKYLNVSSSPIDDLSLHEEARMEGSCEWVVNHQDFLSWQFDEDSSRFFWLTGQPATGKSVITSHVIGCLQDNSCSYYFFKHGDQSRSTLSGLLLSIAYQMAQMSSVVRETLLELSNHDSFLDKNDYRGIWRRLFIGGIFRTKFTSTQYWIIDAFDECNTTEKRSLDTFFANVGKIDPLIPIKIFISSRPSNELESLFAKLPTLHLPIMVGDTSQDIRMFVERDAEDLPAEDEAAREELVNTIVRKAAGCFLWTALVMRQLQDIYTIEEIEEILHEVPEEMDELYNRNLQVMESKPRIPKRLAQAVLTWTICATRPLTVDEIKSAIQLDLNIKVARDLGKSLSTLCNQFVFVDKHNRVVIVHETARNFLLNSELESEFRIHVPKAHLQLGLACLKYLTGDEMLASRNRRAGSNSRHQFDPLGDYACASFSDHLVRSPSSDDTLFLALTKFLQTTILTWIERMAEDNNLGCLVMTTKHFKAYQSRRAKHVAPLQDDISSWAADLTRIVTEFGINLAQRPTAIHDFIPPLCPQTSIIHRQFSHSGAGIQLSGLSNVEWNDRIASWQYEKTARGLASQDQWFATGLSNGIINIYWSSTCQETMRLNHRETVRIVQFGNLAKVLVATGLRLITLWDVKTGSLLWEYKLTSDCLAVEFDHEDKIILAFTRSKDLLTWSSKDGSLLSRHSWQDNLTLNRQGFVSRTPTNAIISSSHKLMAIIYRSMPLCLWDLETQQHLGICTLEGDDGSDTSKNIISACFNPNQALNLLAVSYWSGEVALFDTVSRHVKCHAQLDTQLLSASPDGRTLAGGDSDGNIKLFDFETLQIIYRVNLPDGVAAIAFTGDNLRLIDLRGTQANVWEPSALVRDWDYDGENRSEFSSEVTAPLIQGVGASPLEYVEEITCLRLAYDETSAICGTSNGSLGYYHLNSFTLGLEHIYKPRDMYLSILCLDWNEQHQLVASADSSGSFKVMRLSKTGDNKILAIQTDLLNERVPFGHAVNQLLISPDGSKLIVSSSTTDFMWSLQSKTLIALREANQRTEWKWFTHPNDRTHLVLVEHNMLRAFSWESFGSFLLVIEVLVIMVDYQPQDLKNMIIDEKSATLIFKARPQKRPEILLPRHGAEEFALYTLGLSMLSPQETQILAMPVFQSSKSKKLFQARVPLGTVSGDFGARLLVYISEDGWICSVDLINAIPRGALRRYFFIPSAWLSSNTQTIAAVTEKKDILFVRDNEIAVIKKGLETGDLVLLEGEP